MMKVYRDDTDTDDDDDNDDREKLNLRMAITKTVVLQARPVSTWRRWTHGSHYWRRRRTS